MQHVQVRVNGPMKPQSAVSFMVSHKNTQLNRRIRSAKSIRKVKWQLSGLSTLSAVLSCTEDVAVDSNDHSFVTDADNDCILLLDAQLKLNSPTPLLYSQISSLA